mmetsp:Transcript_55858/g.161772  ORF Transcript_55858/g.161772 Transcript_55858/m.161772 type:complete len:203 (+) Transcript_55858:799-1407(+)
MVRLELLRFFPAVVARTAHEDRDETCRAAAEVDNATAADVDRARRIYVDEPALAPEARNDDRVDEPRITEGDHRLPEVARPLCPASAHDGRRQGAHCPMKEPLSCLGRGLDKPRLGLRPEATRKEVLEAVGVLLEATALVGASEGHRPTGEEPSNGTHTNVDEVLGQDVLDLFCATVPNLHHREASLHEHDEKSAEQRPSHR